MSGIKRFVLCAAMCAASCGSPSPLTLSNEEIKLIKESPETMRVLTIETEEDSLFLNKTCTPLDIRDVISPEFEILSKKMVTTLIHEDGVGIAGPQVGLNRRIIAVQRFDKEGEPIEIYVNPTIIECRGELQSGPEGCLSVPDRRENVLRYQDITIEYLDPESGDLDHPDTVREDIKGFTAVIFQHEIDHLDGILYIYKL